MGEKLKTAKFIVITKVPNALEEGNLADEMFFLKGNTLYLDVPEKEEELKQGSVLFPPVAPVEITYMDLASKTKKIAFIDSIKGPVFVLGEILVVDESGREIGGKGRKPSKWWVEHETFNNVEDAVKRSQRSLEVTSTS